MQQWMWLMKDGICNIMWVNECWSLNTNAMPTTFGNSWEQQDFFISWLGCLPVDKEV